MYGYILRNKIRTTRNFIRNYWMFIAGIMAALAFAAWQIYSAVPLIENISTYLIYVKLGCILWAFFKVYIKKQPPIIINPATLHYLLYSKRLMYIFVLQYVLHLLLDFITAFVISFVMHQFTISLAVFQMAAFIGTYLYIGFLLAWIRYHSTGYKTLLIISAAFAPISVLFGLADGILPVTINAAVIIGCFIFVFRHLNMDWKKYQQDLLFIDTMNTAGARKDMLQMLQITEEQQAKRKKTIFIYHFPLNQRNALSIKTLIETIRTSPRIWVILTSFITVGVLLVRTPLFIGIPLLGQPEIASVIAVSFIVTFFLNASRIFEKQLTTLLDKSRKGLFIPLGKPTIIRNMCIVPIALFTCSALIVGAVLSSRLIAIAIFIAGYNLLFLLRLFLISHTKRKLDVLFNAATFLLAYMLL
jgi:hypothetical protein